MASDDLTGGWLSAHLFYQGSPDLLLAQVVAPLADELAVKGLADSCFFLRYWDGGPHVRFRVHPADGSREQQIRSLITGRSEAFFAAHPAADSVKPADYARMARALAAGERIASYAATMYPNNSVAFIPYRREHDIYGYGDSIRAVERHFAESSRIALALLAGGAPPDRRAAACFSIIVLTWLCAGTSPGTYDAGATEFSQRYLAQQDSLIGLTRHLAAIARSPSATAAGTAAQWCASVKRLRDALTGAAAPPVADRLRPAFAPGPGDPGLWVPAVLDMCAHLACNRLGTTITEERYLRYLAARAVNEVNDNGKTG
jgi:thiopeptide-type bacteriocin biosynthesis protein